MTNPTGKSTSTAQRSPSQTSRRGFLLSSTSAAVGAAALSTASLPAIVAAANASDAIKVGLIGCGDRGTGAVLQALSADPNVALTAMGDLFEDRVEQSLTLLRREVPARMRTEPQRFLGFDAHQKVIDSGVDVVLLCTPPGFRPQHLAAAVAAGKHSFVEIVAAVDAPGVRSFLASAELAKQKNLAIVSGFCWRYNSALRAVREQIELGTIGDVRALYATYYRSHLAHKYTGPRKAEWGDLEWQIRDWHDYTWLSGDVILLLSGGHSVDKMSWWLGDVMPTKAVAIGGRQVPDEGNIFDHGMVAYEYEGGIRGFLGCRGLDGCYTENADYIIGTQGVVTIGRTAVPQITGEKSWRYQGPQNNMYQTEHNELFASIRAGQPINDGVRMANTTLMAILGRMAAYTGQEVTWEQALNSQESLLPEKLDWSTTPRVAPLAIPGLTRLT